MTEMNRAVFLSYASQDAEPAARICASLRAAGIEVWFDQSELRGGDVWDQAIHRQIRDCALFIPVISGHTQSRLEGYFRREWKLAVARTQDMADEKRFLVPVVIDATSEQHATVPELFRAVQWTRLPGGETPPAFCERIAGLLGSPGAPTRPKPTVTAASRMVARRASNGWMMWAVLGALIVGVIGWQAWHGMTPQRVTGASQAATLAVPEKSIAVLPFVDMSEKHDQEYFSDGLTEELLDMLSQVPDLRVPARTSSFYFKGRSDDIATIAQKLRVAHVLEGSVRKAGNTIRVTAQLIRADNGYHLWSKAYDRDFKDIFKVQDEIAAAVVEVLKAKLLPAQEISSRHRTANTDAYREYLLGNQFRIADLPEFNAQALAAYQKAVALDPKYAAAYTGLSEAEWRVADQSTGELAGYQRAAAAAEKAIALAPDLPEAYWARGQLRMNYFFDWSSAQSDYEHALTLDPNFVQALVAEGRALATLGRVPEAIANLRRAITIDPLSVTAWRGLIILVTNTGQLPAARDAIERLKEFAPQYDAPTETGTTLLFEGRPREALASFQGGHHADFRSIGIAMAEHTLGHDAESQRALEFVEQKYGNVWAYQIAEVYAWRGEKGKALDWLERAYRQRDGGLTHVTYDQFFKNLRREPRFKGLLRQLKLPET